MKTVRRMSAVIFEKMAVRNSELSAWYWKEAATKWLQLKQTDKALAAARNADKAPLETRSPRMTHIWHRQLGDIYLKLGEPLLAIPHFEAALKSTEIPGDIAGIQKSLHEAVQQSQP
jgi:tetratricopeptide (TPR) repeat protein